MYKLDLALNNPQWFIWHKTQPTNIFCETRGLIALLLEYKFNYSFVRVQIKLFF